MKVKKFILLIIINFLVENELLVFNINMKGIIFNISIIKVFIWRKKIFKKYFWFIMLTWNWKYDVFGCVGVKNRLIKRDGFERQFTTPRCFTVYRDIIIYTDDIRYTASMITGAITVDWKNSMMRTRWALHGQVCPTGTTTWKWFLTFPTEWSRFYRLSDIGWARVITRWKTWPTHGCFSFFISIFSANFNVDR